MRHLLGILHVAKTYPDVTHLLKNISSRNRSSSQKNRKKEVVGKLSTHDGLRQEEEEEDEKFSVTVDIICNKGDLRDKSIFIICSYTRIRSFASSSRQRFTVRLTDGPTDVHAWLTTNSSF